MLPRRPNRAEEVGRTASGSRRDSGGSGEAGGIRRVAWYSSRRCGRRAAAARGLIGFSGDGEGYLHKTPWFVNPGIGYCYETPCFGSRDPI
jgi:hypothetical protein